MSALEDVADECTRQVAVEGFTQEHDDGHQIGQLAEAAAAYAANAAGLSGVVHQLWPWNCSWWKPKNFRYDLVRAAALLIKEIERFDRMAEKDTGE